MAQSSKNKNSKKKSISQKSKSQDTTSFHNVLVFFRYNAFGKFLLMLILFLLLILFNILISGNNLEVFSLITGIEMVIAMIIGWTIFLLKKNTNSDNEEDEVR